MTEPVTIRRGPSGKALGLIATAIVIVVFSLGSTLVKRADTPGVIVAFWRMIVTALIWNGILLATGRRPQLAHLKRALIPGLFFGLDIAFFYAGATHNSVANAELIAALTPFLVVPIGAKFFHEHINPRALMFAVLGFGGVAIVLFSAPSSGDASISGDIFGALAMCMWVGYIATTRHFRKDMDVVQYMAAMTPFAVMSVVPVALINGDITDVNAHGWMFILLLTLATGVVAHGLMVFAQKTVPIGTIGVAQVAQPAFAAVWSFLILDETLHGWQLVGMALVLGGLLAFVVLNQRTAPRADHSSEAPLASEGSGATV